MKYLQRSSVSVGWRTHLIGFLHGQMIYNHSDDIV